MAAGYVGILTLELFFPESQSLKDKRMHLRSLKAQLHNRTGCSVAEVDHHDTWQRACVTLACVTRDARDADQLLDEAERWVSGRYEVLERRRGTVSPDDWL